VFELKPLSHQAVPAALDKAERYRLLNEAAEAESICRDILAVDPENQRALVLLLLAFTDQFGRGLPSVVAQAFDAAGRLADEYERVYYTGIVHERQAKAALRQHASGSSAFAFGALREAMACYERAEGMRPPGNDDALLRWNTCARLIHDRKLGPASDDSIEPAFD
jgi:hypothetical protein